MKDFLIPKDVKFILSRLEEAGYRADIVGGPVRDFLLGKTPDDFDITTSALPEQTKSVFSDLHTVDTGIKHGTVSVILNKNQYEITTYRIDGEYKDARRPETVSFTESLAEDLRRRDFTVNAMCYSPCHGFTDLHFGKEDLERKVIRAVGDPEKRFSEDALRILRALRFSSVLGFSIEENTARAARMKKELLALVSGERIYTEWKKLVFGIDAYSVIERYSEIISVFLPEISSPRLPSKEKFDKADGYIRTLAIFYLTLGDEAPMKFSEAMRRLKTDRETECAGKEILASVEKYDFFDKISVRKMLSAIGEARARMLLALEETLGKKTDAKMLDLVLSDGVPYRLAELAIGGDDLLKAGIKGRAIGRSLTALLSLVMEEKVKNEKEALLAILPSLN